MSYKLFNLPPHLKDKKIACITLDYELDYGDRTNEFNILNDNFDEIKQLGTVFKDCETPISTFIRTDMFNDYKNSIDALKLISNDFHCHSHTHNTKNFKSDYEIKTNKEIFCDTFGTEPLGYRAPCGVLNDGDTDLLLKNGFKFSSSIFPSYRPKKFNNLHLPQLPFLHENGLLEIPFATCNLFRIVYSMSYLKLLGFPLIKSLNALTGLPNILIIDSHLHDFIYNQKSVEKLPTLPRLAWSRNKKNSLKIYQKMINYLREQGYTFLNMTELYQQLINPK